MLTIDKIVIQETPPEGKNVLWGKPVENGFTLYYYSNGWKPFKLGDNGATVTASGNRIYYTDSTHSTPLYVEGTDVKYQLDVDEVNTSSPADKESYNIGEEIYCDVIIGNHGSAPVDNIVVEGKAFDINSEEISGTKYEVGTLNPEEQSTSLHFSHTVTLEDCFSESPQITFEITMTGVDSLTGKEVEGNGYSQNFPLKPFSVNFLNVDIGDGTPIEGNTVQIWNGNTLVEEWTSIADDSEPHRVYGFLPNQTYRVHVSEAVEDHAAPEDFTFTISDSGEITSPTAEYRENGNYSCFLLEQYKAFNVKILVSNIATGEEIVGAHASILDADGYAIDEWDTVADLGGEEHLHSFRATQDYTYYIQLSAIPDGYEHHSDINFTIRGDGQIETEATVIDTMSDCPVIACELQPIEES